jgi:hypothetical protein
MPSAVGAAGGGANSTSTSTSATPASTATGGGAPQKLPTSGGGPADGAANLQLQGVLQSLVQAVTALSELLKKQLPTNVAGANGAGAATTTAGGPTQAPQKEQPAQVPTQLPTQVPTQGGGPAPKGGGPEPKGGGPADCGPAPAPLQK